MKELRGAIFSKSFENHFYQNHFLKIISKILSQNHWRSQGVAEGTRAPSIKMPPLAKFFQNSLVSSFSVSLSILAYNSTRVQQ